MRSRRILLPVLAFLLLAILPGSARALVLNTANDPPNATDDHDGLCDRLMAEAFRRMGVPLKIVRMPSERALLSADEGTDDGNFARVEGMEKSYPNLLRVPEPVTRFEFVAFSRSDALKPSGWDSLRPLNVGIITGWKILETNLANVRSLTKVRDEHLLFELLLAGKVDVVVYDRMQGKVLLEKLPKGPVKFLDPPLAVREMYPYLHKRHAALVPRLAETLRQMKADGTRDRIAAEVRKRFRIGE